MFVHTCRCICCFELCGFDSNWKHSKCFWKNRNGIEVKEKKEKGNWKIKEYKNVVKFIFENLPKFLIFNFFPKKIPQLYKFFYFQIFFSFTSKPFSNSFPKAIQTILNFDSNHSINKSNAPACMHNHVATLWWVLI